MRVAFVAALIGVAGCSDKNEAPPAAPDAATTTDAVVSDTGGEPAPLDPAADPPPTDLAVVVARAPDADVTPDFSCTGQPLPLARGAKGKRELRTIVLGGSDGERIPGLPFEVFLSNKLGGAPDLSLQSSETGVVEAELAPGFLTYRTAKTADRLEYVAYDLVVPESAPTYVWGAPIAMIESVEALMGGGNYARVAGSGRVVVTIADCKMQPIAGAHLALEVDGAVVPPVTTGAGPRRSYFGENQLPSPATWSSRSGVVTILDVPAKTVRMVARVRTSEGAAPVAVAMRTVPVIADGIVTAFVSPWIEE
jgi:hypothetical protein